MKKNIIIFYPFDISNVASGSRVRPYKIYESFLKSGFDVFLISGNKSERKKIFKRFKSEDVEKYSYCYFELPTFPINPLIDYQILFYLKRKKIPIGVYYRDAYWKFRNYFRRNEPQRSMLLLRYKADFAVLRKTVSSIFFPSLSFSRLFKIKKIKKIILPPGAEIKNDKFYRRKREPAFGIYVGGISERYGLELLLDAFDNLQKSRKINLILVCRKEDLAKKKNIIKEYSKKNWLCFFHESGKDLERLYERADFGILPLKKDNYNDLALPVKLFEYLSYGLPVVATDCYEIGKFVKKNKIGLVCKDNPESLARAILEITGNKEKYEKVRKNTFSTLGAGNLWEDRVKKIDESLTQK